MVSESHTSRDDRQNNGSNNQSGEKREKAEDKQALSRNKRRMTQTGGFVAFVAAGILFVITLGFFFHYYGKGTFEGYVVARNWGIGSFILVGIALWGAYDYYVVKPAKISAEQKTQPRPYVVFRKFELIEPLAAGRIPTIEYEIENTSTTQKVQLDMWGFNSSYIDYPEPGVGLPYPHPLVSGAAPGAPTPIPGSSEIIYYRPGKHEPAEMAPTQKLVSRITLDGGLTAEQIDALNEGPTKARLFIYGRGKYTDKDGNAYDFNSCHEYDPVNVPYLRRCDDSVKIVDSP